MLIRPVVLTAALLGLTACLPAEERSAEETGASDYASHCAACHGASGKGDGEGAAGLAKAPADLTVLSQRNKGAFPTTRVMAQIWGYSGAKGRGIMPDFGPLLEGDAIPYDGGDGILTPTPKRLVALAEYLKTLQK